MKSNTFWADRIADLIEEGYSSDEAIIRITNELSKKKISLKVGNIIKEFKKVYGHNPFHYELNTISSVNTEEIDESLFEEFMSFDRKN